MDSKYIPTRQMNVSKTHDQHNSKNILHYTKTQHNYCFIY